MDINSILRKNFKFNVNVDYTNKIKENIIEQNQVDAVQSFVQQPDKEAVEGQKKLSSWLDDIENSQTSSTKRVSSAENIETAVGTGSMTNKAIKDAGIDIDKYGKYFIQVYSNGGTAWYRFNPDTIKADFPRLNIQTIADLKSAIDSNSNESSGVYSELEKFNDRIENGEFTKSGTTVNPEFQEYKDLVKNYLLQDCNYSEEYTELILNFCERETDYQTSYVNKTNILNDLLKVFKDTYSEILASTNNIVTYGYDNSNKWNNELHPSNLGYCCEATNSDSLQARFLYRIYISTFGKYTSYEKRALSIKLMDSLGIKINKDGYTDKPFNFLEEFSKLDVNKNGNWFEELYEKMSELTKNVTSMSKNEIESAATIGVNYLFENKEEITSLDLYSCNNNPNWQLSNDAGVRKFCDFLKNLASQFGVNNYYDQLDLYNALIIRVNKECGIQNNSSMTRETIEKLNELGGFEKLNEIINSDELRNEYYYGVDSNIDEFGQGKAADCWILSGVLSLRASEFGRKIINDAIKQHDDGSVTVCLKGVDKTYTFTPEEIVEAKESTYYANGDNDILIIELALEQYQKQELNRENIDYGRSENFMKIFAGAESHSYFGDNNNDQGWTYYTYEKVVNILSSFFEAFKNGNIGFTVSTGTNTITDINGDVFSTIGGHLYTIVDMYMDDTDPSKNTVTIINPYKSDEKYTISWDEFSKLNMGIIEHYMSINEDIIQSKLNYIIENFTQGKLSYGDVYFMISELGFSRDWRKYDDESENNYYFKFDYQGKHYKIICSKAKCESQCTDTVKTYKAEDLLKMTASQSMIDKYFEPVAIIDGEPYIYRLKNGVTIGEFYNEVNKSQNSMNIAVQFIQNQSVYNNNQAEYLNNMIELSGLKGQNGHYEYRGHYFNIEKIVVDEHNNYTCVDQYNLTCQKVFNALFETIKMLINDIDNNLLNIIGGDNRLKQVLSCMWNDFTTGGTTSIEQIMENIKSKLFNVSIFTEYLNK